MDKFDLLKALTVLAALVFHTQVLYHAQGIFCARRRHERWFILTALVNTLLMVLIWWLALPIFTTYSLLSLLYFGEFALLFRPDPAALALVGGLFPFTLLCVCGVMIPLLALLYGTNMYALVADPFRYTLSLFCSIVACCLLLLVMRARFPDERLRLLLGCRNQKRFACYSLCILLAYLILESEVYYYDFPHMWTVTFHLITSVVAFVAFAALLWYAVDISAYIEYELKTRRIEKQLQRQVVHYQQYTRYVAELRAFKHDYKHMMETVRHLVTTDAKEQASTLLGQMSEQMESQLQYTPFSNHMVVDAILQECAGRCSELGVAFAAVANLPASIGLSELSLCRLFGNLADNAFEACAHMTSGERFIKIESSVRGDWVTIELRNSFSGEIELADGLPVSHKNDSAQHGLGLLSVRSLVESTGGFIKIDIDREHRIFCVRLHLVAHENES